MKVIAQPEWKRLLSRNAINGLSVNDKRNTNGSDEILVNPAYESISDDEIKGMIEDILSKERLTPKLREIEDSNEAKFGPRSIAKPWSERRQSLLDYFHDEEDHDPGRIGFKSGNGTLRPASIERVMKNLLRSSSAGLPYLRKKGLVLQEAQQDWKQDKGVYPCMLYTRTQEQGKTRNVLGYPVSDTIWEQQYYIPILSMERMFPHRMALVGPDEVDAAITRQIMAKHSQSVVFCVDFSAYDASLTPKLIFDGFQIFCQMFQPRYHPDIYELYRRFVTIPFYTPDGEWQGSHGVPSGSSFTNAIDSMVQYNVARGPEADWRFQNCQIQGDDGLYIVDWNDLDELKTRFISAGLMLNESKSDTFDDHQGVYLQRYYHPDYRTNSGGLGGVYSIYRAMNRIKYLERWTDIKTKYDEGSDFFALRTISILENCKHHPSFESLVRLAHRLDKFDLNYSNQGLTAYSRDQESKVRAGVFNQYGLQKGINKFETIKLLKTL